MFLFLPNHLYYKITTKATFYKNGDHSDFYYLSDFLEDGEKYTLSEIIDGEISYKRDRNQENWKFDYFTDSYIDCGLDGDIEYNGVVYSDAYFGCELHTGDL